MNYFWNNDIAVLLNANARKVSRRIVERVKQVVPETQLYVSKTIDEGRDLVRDVVKRGYTHLVLGGGDGTLVEVINQLRDSLRDMGRGDWAMPKLGFLKLGTGNAWSGLLGADNGKRSLPRMASPDKWRLVRFQLLESDKRLFHFGGMGWDAAILNDYYLFKQRFQSGLWRRWFAGLGGYLTSMFLKTIPDQLRQPDRPHIRVVNRWPEAYAVTHADGAQRLNVGVGETIYEGPANVFGGSTTPYYGFNLAAFPFARLKHGFMDFRVVTASVMECLSHWHAIWTGRYAAPTFIDYLVKDVSVEIDRPLPLQIGGDPAGMRQTWDLSVSDFSVQVLDLTAA